MPRPKLSDEQKKENRKKPMKLIIKNGYWMKLEKNRRIQNIWKKKEQNSSN